LAGIDIANRSKYIDSVIFGAPYNPVKSFLTSTPWGTPDAVYHGSTSSRGSVDRYAAAMEMGIYKQLGEHDFSSVTASQIVERIMNSRATYEERQRKKGAKVAGEEAHKLREQMEEEQRLKEAAR
jgi:ethanolamine-phosphate cytidylyltransferase